MSFLKKWRQKQTEENPNPSLTKLGLLNQNDEKFAARLELYKDFCKYVSDSRGITGDALNVIEEIMTRASDINNVLHQAAIPFGRAGTQGGYMKIATGWSRLYTIMIDFASSVDNQLKKIDKDSNIIYAPETQKEELVLKLRHFFEKYFLTYALIVASGSWMKDDVSPSWSITVQAPPMQQGFRPTSGDDPIQADRNIKANMQRLQASLQKGNAEEKEKELYPDDFKRKV